MKLPIRKLTLATSLLSLASPALACDSKVLAMQFLNTAKDGEHLCADSVEEFSEAEIRFMLKICNGTVYVGYTPVTTLRKFEKAIAWVNDALAKDSICEKNKRVVTHNTVTGDANSYTVSAKANLEEAFKRFLSNSSSDIQKATER